MAATISSQPAIPVPYQYSPLTGFRVIRLIRFLEADNDPTFTFIQINLDKSPPYLALSYTWGSGLPKHVIHMDGQELTVGENLYAALKALQHSRTRIRYLWVDAICINQADLAERSQQVGLMNSIYRCAERVVVWLGSEGDDSDFAIDTIRRWSKEISKNAFASEKAYWEKVASIKPSDPLFCGPPGTDGCRAWLAIRNLWERSWWRRAWIVQEATLSAPERLELLCGNASIYWDDFAVSIDIAQCLGRHEGFQTFENWRQAFPTRLHSFRVDRESGYYLRFLKVLEEMRPYECGDDRDKVFAALGMAADVTSEDIAPDYEKSVAEVYTDVVRLTLGTSELHSFDFLGYIVRPEGLDPKSKMWTRYKDLPTWVPDWRTRISISPIYKHQDSDHPNSGSLFCAGGRMKSPARVDGLALLVNGIHVDVVQSVLSVCDMNSSEGGLNIQKEWRETMPNTDYPSGGSVLEAFDRTIVTDVVQEIEPHDNLFRRNYRVDWSLIEQDPSKLEEGDIRRRHFLEVAIARTTFGRRTFWTSQGYLGIGPASMTAHDIICIFSGGQLLYVLRGTGSGTYGCIGECYVHGLMDGEALSERGRKEEMFTII